MNSIMNIINQLLAYSDNTGTTDNPQKRDFDWSRKFHSISVQNPAHDRVQIPSGVSEVLFDGITPTDLADGISEMQIEAVRDSVYRLSVTSGPSGFRTARVLTGLTDCDVTINNNSVATFKFTGATTDAVVGDIMHIAGSCSFDAAPYSFSSLNSGNWNIIAVSGDTIQAVRPVGQPFSGVTESVTTIPADQVSMYSSAGIQTGDKFEISDGFSLASHRVYEVVDARPEEILFSSVVAIPEESGVTFNTGDVVFYSNAKKIIYIESDQNIIVQFNNDISDLNKISPFEVGNPDLVGFLHQTGVIYKTVIINKSVNVANVRFFTAE